MLYNYNDKCSAAEKAHWLRTILSVPCTFKLFDRDGDQFAEAVNYRNEIAGQARAVVFNARQIIFNVWGFKLRRERIANSTLSAEAIANFWAKNVKEAPGSEAPLAKSSAIDACITVMKRFFIIPKCHKVVQDYEEDYGPDTVWNSVWKYQELISRCRTPAKIEFVTLAIDDWLRSGKITSKEITINSLKTSTRTSITDVILHQEKLAKFLTGTFKSYSRLTSLGLNPAG